MDKVLRKPQQKAKIIYSLVLFLGIDILLTLIMLFLNYDLLFFGLKYLLLGLIAYVVHRKVKQEPNREVWGCMEKQLAYAGFLERINHILIANLDLRETFAEFVQELAKHISFECCSIFRIDEQYDQYQIYKACIGKECYSEGQVQTLSTSILKKVVDSRRYWIFANDSEMCKQSELMKDQVCKSILQIPMICQDQVIGIFALGSQTSGYYQPKDMELLEPVVKRVSAALQNSILYQKTCELSLKDYLTDLANRRALDMRLEYEYRRAKRYKVPFSILVVDVDYFKPFNDKYGHLAGDQALRELAEIMRNEVRDVDLVSRFGGEEFVILLPETSREQASIVAERIRRRISEHVFLPGKYDAQLTVCIGVGSYTEDIGGIESILHGADMKLYSAKSCGRNKVIYMG